MRIVWQESPVPRNRRDRSIVPSPSSPEFSRPTASGYPHPAIRVRPTASGYPRPALSSRHPCRPVSKRETKRRERKRKKFFFNQNPFLKTFFCLDGTIVNRVSLSRRAFSGEEVKTLLLSFFTFNNLLKKNAKKQNKRAKGI